tara:strand:- start:1608 stop:1820 length:213 start_codon:yes stop_codon:yes gene_type:complete
MKLILPSEFKLLQFDKINDVDVNTSGGKRVIKIYRDDQLIAKSIRTKTRHKTGMRYFAIKGYEKYLSEVC